mgnify:FL=1
MSDAPLTFALGITAYAWIALRVSRFIDPFNEKHPIDTAAAVLWPAFVLGMTVVLILGGLIELLRGLVSMLSKQ